MKTEDFAVCEGKRALVTGGSRGIGLECTRLLLGRGFHVTVLGRDFSEFEFAGDKRVSTVSYDISDTGMIPMLMKHIGAVDVLVNNAGMMNSLPYNEYPDGMRDMLMTVNLYAPAEFIRAAAPAMKEAGGGRIINMASVAGETGHPDIWYGASKAGLINITKSFAKLFAKDGISVNCVAPGPVRTDMLGVIPQERRDFMLSSVWSGRFAEPAEIAETVLWLASDAPAYITGTCIDMNNGAFPR